MQGAACRAAVKAEEPRFTPVAPKGARGRYADLYDFAPVGLFILTPEATISEINLTGAALLGEERGCLLQRRFAPFVAAEDRNRWNRYCSLALQREGKQGCELTLTRADGTAFHARLDFLHIRTAGNARMAYIAFTDVSERKCLENEIEESRRLLRELADKTETLREEERKHIAREVHDELGQILAALRMDTALINMRFGVGDAALLGKTQGMTALLDRADRCVRNIVSSLRPAVLDMGIVSGVRWLCDEYLAHTGGSCVLHAAEEHIDLDEVRAVAVFRIVQELLTNAARHAGASSVEITLARHANDLHVEVCDNGKGFDPAAAAKNKSFGLLGMRERVIALGGDIEIVSVPDQGTVVTAIVPLKSDGDNE